MKRLEVVHPKDGIDISELDRTICSNEVTSTFGYTFALCMPELTTELFDNLIETERLEAPDYCVSLDVSHRRKFENVALD